MVVKTKEQTRLFREMVQGDKYHGQRVDPSGAPILKEQVEEKSPQKC